jgi:hypothetical protein
MTILPRRPALAAPILAALAALALSAAPASAQAPAARAAGACPGYFTVLHDDRIGKVSFPAGPYTVVTSGVGCSTASRLIARFLQDWDGRLPKPWTLVQLGERRRFVQGGTTNDIQMTPVSGPKPGPSNLVCPGSFDVLHDDRIGALAVPRGQYRLTLLSAAGLTCAQAAQAFAAFLDRPAGNLPSPWRLDARTRTFTRAAGVGFRIARIGSGGGGRTPSRGFVRCAGTFRILHNDRIGPLRVPAGPYFINVKGRQTCASASSNLVNFLARGRVSAGWTQDAAIGVFATRSGSGAFQVEPAS